ncbi:MAG: hypothetical protein H6741_25800 [Alphaproteobacteria bacterium]|nr:hypothetical protein [Alphaproteobacteria bacterium]MCB9796126.1 hypothetical protein [Alphaproteobacteria bacterium]
MRASFALASPRPPGQDRALLLPRPEGWLVALADGAGGQSGGAEAAEAVMQQALRVGGAQRLPDAEGLAGLLRACDTLLWSSPECGLSTGLLASLRTQPDGRLSLALAWCGDSEAWSFGPEGPRRWTEGRVKPLLGSGRAQVGARSGALEGPLVLGSDGLWKYAPLVRIAAALPDAQALARAARLPSGGLQDDVAVVVIA